MTAQLTAMTNAKPQPDRKFLILLVAHTGFEFAASSRANLFDLNQFALLCVELCPRKVPNRPPPDASK
jgi:hypothetical protein